MLRTILLIVIFLNFTDAIGIAMQIITADTGQNLITKIGASFDDVLWPVSIAVIGIAVVKMLPLSKRQA
jgi:hypothetical protein